MDFSRTGTAASARVSGRLAILFCDALLSSTAAARSYFSPKGDLTCPKRNTIRHGSSRI